MPYIESGGPFMGRDAEAARDRTTKLVSKWLSVCEAERAARLRTSEYAIPVVDDMGKASLQVDDAEGLRAAGALVADLRASRLEIEAVIEALDGMGVSYIFDLRSLRGGVLNRIEKLQSTILFKQREAEGRFNCRTVEAVAAHPGVVAALKARDDNLPGLKVKRDRVSADMVAIADLLASVGC